MLSVERPSGRPSCSSSLQASSALKSSTDGAAASPAETLAPDPAGRDLSEPAPPLPPRFSIRDYVLSSRSKDIKKNWPFHLKFLRCLLEHDIHDLLPPFEAPDLVRVSPSEESSKTPRSCIGHRESKFGQNKVEHLSNAGSNRHNNKNNICSDLLMLKSLAEIKKPLSYDSKLKGDQGCMPRPPNDIRFRKTSTESTVTCNANSEQSNPTSKPSCSLPLGETKIPKYPIEAEVTRAPVHEKQVTVKEPVAKKCKLVVKASATLDPKLGEDASINSGTVSDSMASKVCPVCKIFSSTSNTTLNAHIDQCLSMEPEANCITDTTIKHKVKSTKKRLMVDIYTTASRCTLQDLDKRNGTNWATDPTLTVPFHDVPTDNKEGCSSSDQINNATEKVFIEGHATDPRDGAVFFDASGTKVCILSKLNTVLPVKEAQLMKSRKLKKEAKKQMQSACSKGGNLIPHHPKSVKLKPESKKFCSLKLLKDEVPLTSPRNDCPIDGERDGPYLLQNSSQMKMKPDGHGIATQQVFSKLSRGPVKDVRSPSSSVQVSPAPSPQPVPSVSAKSKSLVFKISQHPDGSNSSSKPKSLKILLDLPPHQDIRGKESQFPAETGLCSFMGGSPSRSGPRPTQSRPSGNRGYPRSKKKKILAQKSGKPARLCTMSTENRHLGLGGKPLGRSQPPVDNCKGKKLRLVSKTLGKHRLLKKSHKKKKKQTSVADNVFREHHRKEMVISDSEILDNFLSSQTDSLINQLSYGQSKYAQSRPEIVVSINGRKDDSSGSYFEGASSESQVVNLGCQTRCLPDAGTTEKSYVENISDPRGSIEPAQCGGPMATSNSSLESWSRLVENVNFIGGKESLGEPLAPRTFNHDMVHSGINASNVDVITSMEMRCQQEFKSLGNSCSGVPYMECPMNTAPVPGLSGYATSSTNDGTEFPQGNSSVTSNKISYNDGLNVVVDSTPSDTPESGASIISDPVDKSNREDSVRPVVVEGESISGVSDVLAPTCLLNACDSTGEDTERYKMADASAAPKPPGYWGGRGMSSGSEFFAFAALKQCNSAGQVLSMAEKQLPSVSASHLRLRDNDSSCSHELTVTVGSSNLISRSTPVEENLEQPTCGDSKLTEQNHELEHQFPPHPVFRLMGKNLLVPRKEVEHIDGGKTDCTHKSACDVWHTFHHRSLPHNSYVMNPISYESPQHQFPEKWRDTAQLPLHPPHSQQGQSLSGYHFQNVHRSAECNQSWPCSENLHSLAYHGERSAVPGPYQKCMTVGQSPNHACPLIIINDSQESKAEIFLPPPKPASAVCSTVTASNSQQLKRLSCNAAHYAIEMKEMPPNQLRPGMYCSNARSGGIVQSGTGWYSSVGSGTPNPPFVVPSSKLTHSLYYFPSMR